VTSLKPGRHIGDAQQADIVLRVEKSFQIGQEIAHFAPVEKALAANQVIPNAGLTQGRFQRPGLGIGAKEDRVIGPRRAPRQARVFDLLDDARASASSSAKVCSVIFGPSLFATRGVSRPADVVFDQRIGGLEDGVGRAVILLELDDSDLREMLFHVEQVGDLRPTPAVDALIVIADHAEIAMLLVSA